MSIVTEPYFAAILTGAAGFGGAVLGVWAAGRRDRKNRHNEHVGRLLERRAELYPQYLHALDVNADQITGQGLLDAESITIDQTHKVEREMRLFADSGVLAIADDYRDAIRKAAHSWADMTDDAQSGLLSDLHLASSVLLAAMRADLGVERLAFGSRLRRLWTFRRLAKGEIRSHSELRSSGWPLRQADREPKESSSRAGES